MLVCDIDGDGTQEVIGIVDGMLLALRFGTATGSDRHVERIPQDAVADLGASMLVSEVDAVYLSGSIGRGRNVHNRTSIPVLTVNGSDGVHVVRPGKGLVDGVDTLRHIPAQNESSARVATGGCVLVVSPNPTQAACRFRLMSCFGPLTSVRILSPDGRLVWQWSGDSPEGVIEWDGIGIQGEPLGTGMYLVQATIPQGIVTTSLIRL